MVQESLSRRERESRAGDELAEKLDALSKPLAERVLGRAIELDHEAQAKAEAAANTIDYAMLRDVALEVGISEESLKQALLEELNTEKDHNAKPIERATLPNTVRGGLFVQGMVEEVAERLRKHLENVEGLHESRHEGMVTEWTSHSPWGQRTVRTWTIPQGQRGRQLLEIDEETGGARKGFWRWVVALIVLAALFGSPLGGLIGLGIFVGGIVAVAGWMKRIARKARKGINRALNAIADGMNDEEPRDWLDVWERTQGRR